jgi:predicted secreted protein
MNMFFKSLLYFVLILPPCAFSKDMVVFLNSNQSQFSLELKSNPTTGYRWEVMNYSKEKLTLMSSNYKQSQTMLIGSGGYQKFIFSVKHPEQTIDQWISLKYARPWEKKSGLTQRVHVLTKKQNSINN